MKKKCRNKKCQRYLPEGYKYKYCENCRNKHIKGIKDTGKTVLGVVVALTFAARGKINKK